MQLARLYLRASTVEQDATRARAALDAFAVEHGLHVVARYVEHDSGAKLARPELFRLLDDCAPGDVLLIEAIDRLSRLSATDWQRLRTAIETRQVRLVALDLPTSWMLAKPSADEFTGRMLAAINGMMLDILAAVSRKDYEDRRRRQGEGIAKAKANGVYRGRPEDTLRNKRIAEMLGHGMPWTAIQQATGCSRATVAKIAKR